MLYAFCVVVRLLVFVLFVFILRHSIVTGYYDCTLDIRLLYVSLSLFCFRLVTWVNINEFASKSNMLIDIIEIF